MAQLDVEEQLAQRFAAPLSGAAKRRIVIWHDAQCQFEELFDALAGGATPAKGDGGQLALGVDGALAAPAGGDESVPVRLAGERPVRFVKARDGAMFSVKKLVARDDEQSDFLIYRQRERGQLEGDLLADVELYAEHFQAD